jgi:hypothetical protein
MMLRCDYGRLGLAASILFIGSSAAQDGGSKPETVMVTYHARPGSEAALAGAIARHGTVARDLKLIGDTPRITLRGTEDGNKTYFVDVFTWRDAKIPDAAPPAIQAIWAEMNKLVETRGGRPGIDITEVSVVEP